MASGRFLIFISFALVMLSGITATSLTVQMNLETTTKTSYNRLIQELRDWAKGKEVFEGIPMVGPPKTPPEYAMVSLLAKLGAKDINVSVVLNRTNLYVLGYGDDLKNAVFFPDGEAAMKTVFPDFKQAKTKFESSYGSLKVAAKLDREDMKMSLGDLKESLLNVYGKDVERNQARFMLYCTQALAESARFKYLQSKFASGTGAVPDHKAPRLENQWSTISTGIKNAIKRKINPPLHLANIDGSEWVVTQVAEIKPDMGILSYEA